MRRSVAVAVAVPAMAGAGALAQRAAEQRDHRRWPPPGRLVDAGGVTLHTIVEGRGPTVLIDSGLGGSSIEWAAVADDLRGECTVVRYDRPGFGWSPPVAVDRSPRAAAERMAQLLTVLDVEVPCVAVGHSLGGLHVRVLAALYPHLVRGLVLVDPSHEDMLADESTRRMSERVNRVIGVVARSGPLGTARVLGPLYARTITAQVRRALDPSEREQVAMSTRLTMCTAGGLRAVAAEMAGVPSALDQVRAIVSDHPLRDVPVTVITATAPGRTAAEKSARATIGRLHEQLASASAEGRVVPAPESGHLVPVDQPDLVARCIREALQGPA